MFVQFDAIDHGMICFVIRDIRVEQHKIRTLYALYVVSVL